MAHFKIVALFPVEGKRQFDQIAQWIQEKQPAIFEHFEKKVKKPIEKYLIDDKGTNDMGKFDYYSLLDLVTSDTLLGLLDKGTFVPHALLLPNTSWIESPTWFYVVNEKNRQEFEEWRETVVKKVKEYGNSICLAIDCHT